VDAVSGALEEISIVLRVPNGGGSTPIGVEILEYLSETLGGTVASADLSDPEVTVYTVMVPSREVPQQERFPVDWAS
jgi:hypothetical protein